MSLPTTITLGRFVFERCKEGNGEWAREWFHAGSGMRLRYKQKMWKCEGHPNGNSWVGSKWAPSPHEAFVGHIERQKERLLARLATLDAALEGATP